ncbi:MAG: RNA methyltransferase [Saprospiraceae bacterium]
MLEDLLTEERRTKLIAAAAKSQLNVTVVLENVHDPHNIGAILRTCDSVGIREIYALYNEPSRNAQKQYIGLNSASGALKWVDVHFFSNTQLCFEAVKKKYDLIAGTHLSKKSISLYSMDLKKSIALVFGNEKDGITTEVLPYLDVNFIIPQHGMVQSLNVSVACAISLFEMARQRNSVGSYDNPYEEKNFEMKSTFDKFLHNHFQSLKDK